MAPSLEHEAPLLLLGARPVLLLELLGVQVPPGARVELPSGDFTQAVPHERRADAVVTIEQDGEVTAAFVVEVQTCVDEEKHFAWPLYVASLHARLRCRTSLVILATDARVAGWARAPIPTLGSGGVFAPLVFGPEDIPRIGTLDEARRSPELAVLSALTHGAAPGGAPVVETAIAVAAELDDARAKTYFDLIYSALGEVARAALEALMPLGNYEYKSDFAKHWLAEGRVEGRVEGRSEGRVEGRDEGRVLEARKLLLAIVAQRALGPSEGARARVEACEDAELLERWVLRATSAAEEGEIFCED